MLKNFVIGGLSGMIATSVVSIELMIRLLSQIQPMDMIKVRIQLKSEAKSANLSPFNVAREIYSKEGGITAFYKGQVYN